MAVSKHSRENEAEKQWSLSVLRKGPDVVNKVTAQRPRQVLERGLYPRMSRPYLTGC